MVSQSDILKGYNEIRIFLRISTEKARELVSFGAPVAVDSVGRPRAEKAQLWQWFKENAHRI